MKNVKLYLFFSFISIFVFSSFITISDTTKTDSRESYQRISFKIKGTGTKGISVKIGIGSRVGSGSCCSTVSPNTTSSFTGNIGDVVYDSERNRVITKIHNGLDGAVIDLKDYY
jgi:hypothetical protein